MNLIANKWPDIQARYDAFWAMENNDRPLMYVTAPKVNTSEAPLPPESIDDRWLDFDSVIARNRYNIENTHYAGEAFPRYMPNLGPDIFGAILGCELIFGASTSWSEPIISNWKDFDAFTLNRENKYYKLIAQLTDMAVADAKGDYLVGITDLHPGADALVSLRGPENLCLDLYDCPDVIMDLPVKLWPVMRDLYMDLYTRTAKNQEGGSTWLPCYHRKPWYVTSCDFICLISSDAFDTLVVPELLLESAFFDANVFHLDGPGAIRHLDRLLEIPGLGGIQWVPGSGNPPVSQWRTLLEKVQYANKRLHLSVSSEEIPVLSEFLRPEGVILSAHCDSPDEADSLVKQAQNLKWGR